MDLEDLKFLKDFMNLPLKTKFMKDLFQLYLINPEGTKPKIKSAILAYKIKY